MSDMWQVTSDRKGAWRGVVHSRHPSPVTRHASAFTLIEMMIVVAIIGLIAALGVPSILQVFRKEGMRRAVSEVRELLGDARARAIYTGQTTQVVFHPAEKRLEISAGPAAPLMGTPANISASTLSPSSLSIPQGFVSLPDNVFIAMLDIDLLDRSGDEAAGVCFYPNGTCQELVLVLHSGDEWQKITLEFSTALASAGPVTR
jgi:prepilin-type N-terminal cleavage/methylation domain-containing protein